MAASPKLLRDDRLATDGIQAPGRQHPVQHRHADGSLSLLGREAAGSQTRSDQRLVTTQALVGFRGGAGSVTQPGLR